MDKLRIVVAKPLADEYVERIRQADERFEVVIEPDLLPPMRWPSDHSGDQSFKRTPEQQARFEELVDSADVLYGIPDTKSSALARAVHSNPRLKWVQIMAAGGGAQVKSHRVEEALEALGVGAAPAEAARPRSKEIPRGKTTTPSGNLGQRRSELLEAAGVEQSEDE